MGIYLPLALPVVLTSLAILGALFIYTAWIFFDGSARARKRRGKQSNGASLQSGSTSAEANACPLALRLARHVFETLPGLKSRRAPGSGSPE